jgi:hypothetical protein
VTQFDFDGVTPLMPMRDTMPREMLVYWKKAEYVPVPARPAPSDDPPPPPVHGAEKMARAVENARLQVQARLHGAEEEEARCRRAAEAAQAFYERHPTTRELREGVLSARRDVEGAEMDVGLARAALAAFDSEIEQRAADLARLAELDEQQSDARVMAAFNPIVQDIVRAAELLARAITATKQLAIDTDRARSTATSIARQLGIGWAPSRTDYQALRSTIKPTLRRVFAAAGYDAEFLRELTR